MDPAIKAYLAGTLPVGSVKAVNSERTTPETLARLTVWPDQATRFGIEGCDCSLAIQHQIAPFLCAAPDKDVMPTIPPRPFVSDHCLLIQLVPRKPLAELGRLYTSLALTATPFCQCPWTFHKALAWTGICGRLLRRSGGEVRMESGGFAALFMLRWASFAHQTGPA